MDATELKNFSVDELKGRVLQWREELFRSKFKTQSAEKKDTSVLKKLRKDIARGLTILTQKQAGEVQVKAPIAPPTPPKKAKVAKTAKAVEAAPQDVVANVVEDKKATKTAKKGKKRQEGEKK